MPFIKSTWLVKKYLQLDVNKLLTTEFSYLYSKKRMPYRKRAHYDTSGKY